VANFYTNVIEPDPRFDSKARIDDIDLLEPVTRALVQAIVSGAQALGFPVMVYETYRSQARQEELFAIGATQLRLVGVHHYGLACDIVKMVNGEPSWKGDFSFLSHLARAHGLIWGGDWGDATARHSFVDVVHVQRCTVARQVGLFRGEWYPDASYNPYEDSGHTQELMASVKEDLTRPARSARSSRRRRQV
jgi:hypothetical protein